MAELGKKLQLKAGQRLFTAGIPATVLETLSQEGYLIVQREAEELDGASAALLFVKDIAEFEGLVAQTLPQLQPQALLWIAYPKKTSGIKTNLTRDEGWKVLAKQGYEAVRQVAVDEVWSALRFRQQSERNAPSTFGMDMPGIDRKAKTVEIPDDLKAALQEQDLTKSFERLAFTHRKEYVVAVLEAKRPETRSRRIAKTVERVAKLAEKQA